MFYPPTCVGLRYGRLELKRLEAFLGPRSGHFWVTPRHHEVGSTGGFPYPSHHFPHLAPQSTQRLTLADASPLRSFQPVRDCLPVVHHLRLSASAKARLTRRGLTFRRKPQGFGACGSHTCCATHASILTGLPSTPGSPDASRSRPRSPTKEDFSSPHRFGATLEPRYIVRAAAFDQ